MTLYHARFSVGMLAAAALILCAAAVILFAPVQIPSSIRTPGKAVMVKEWCFMRDRNGGYSNVMLDHERKTVKSSTVTQFERGDAAEFSLRPSIIPGAAVENGDTVGVILSHAIDEELTSLKGQLSVERASLAVALTGEKSSVVQEAINQVNHARIRADEQRRVVERHKGLWRKEYISQQDFETLETTLKLYEAQVAIAESQLEAATTGAKREEVEMIRARISALEADIAALEKRRGHLVMRSPFRGIVFRIAVGDTLAFLGDDTTYLINMPVKLRDLPRIDRSRDVIIRIQGFKAFIRGSVNDVGNTVGIVRGEQVAMVTVSVREGNDKLRHGLVVDCTIPCKSISLRDALLAPFTIR